jgi:GNAT superfamily N-acetyltransferase
MQTRLPGLVIRAFDWSQWRALWQLRLRQLAEAGILLDDSAIPSGPEDLGLDDYEWDYNHIAEVYLCGAGWFWLAWVDGTPAGHVGAQDLGERGVELRRMYVSPEYRRKGVGTALVRELLLHCAAKGTRAVELWTESGGVGMQLYQILGFGRTAAPGAEFHAWAEQTHFKPGTDECRMRLDLIESRG